MGIVKKRKPKFPRQRAHAFARIQRKGWKRPRGKDSLQRRGIKSRGARPGIGYRQPKKIRGLHPSGFEERLIHNVKELEKLDPKKHAVRIASPVGRKKRAGIIKKADELKLKILNR